MGLLKILKTVMGLNGTGSSTRSSAGDSTRQDVDVSVEHEPEPATESESAVKGTTDAEMGGTTTDTESTVEPAVEPETDAEPETEPGTEPDSGGEPDATSDDETDAEPADEAESDDPEIDGADEPVDTISGIGPAYADRLGEVGIETVGDLATADAASVAADSDLSEKRVQGWIDDARGDE